jgi:hypothetical protein
MGSTLVVSTGSECAVERQRLCGGEYTDNRSSARIAIKGDDGERQKLAGSRGSTGIGEECTNERLRLGQLGTIKTRAKGNDR